MSLKDALAGIKEAQEPQQIELKDATTAAKPPRQPKTKPTAKKVQESTGAKSTNPEFMQLKVYVRKITKTAAARKWEDQGGGDVSDLIENLLTKYLSS